MFFLHGNVGAGFCEECKTFGPIQNFCQKCEKPYKKVPLLYPVNQKDYNSNIFIRDQWNVAKDYISRAGIITIYGYGAPSSDKEACTILKSAFTKYDGVHKYDAIEIIERPGIDYKDISETWKFFFSLTNGHYDIVDSFYDSSLAEAPRRTLQYQYKRFFEGYWGVPKVHFSEQDSFESTAILLAPLLENEQYGDYRII